MVLKFYLFRLSRYYRNNGLAKTIQRVGQKVIQRVFLNDETLFYSDLTKLKEEGFKLPEGFVVDAIERRAGISDTDMKRLSDYIGKDEMEYEIENRFSKSAILWLAKQNGDLAGFVWSIKASPIEPYYFPLGENDVLLFDGAVLPEHRGQNIYPTLLRKVFHGLKEKDAARVIFDAYKWNKPVLRSFEKIHAIKLCDGRKIRFFGRNIVIWKLHSKKKSILTK